MLDYYALPNDVPGMSTRPQGNAIERVEAVEAAIDANVGDTRFRSYLALHEFEALLYSDPAACGAYLSSPALSAALSKAIAECGGPEHVNDSPAGAPSKRIRAAHPPYQKVLHGPLIADKIGLASIRGECPHFDSWLSWLESFGS